MAALELTVPLVAAPMAGGPSTVALVVAAARSGGVGFLAAGYQSPTALQDQIDGVRAAGVPFGVNVFAPGPQPVEPAEFRAYATALEPEAARYGLSLRDARPVEDDDSWQDKVDLLRRDPVPLVSFTFGIPAAAVIAGLRRAGTTVLQTVTNVDEARAAEEAGVDALIVQNASAGGHFGTLTPGRAADPFAAIKETVSLPLLAAGGLATAADVSRALRAGAKAAVLGTALLLADESGANPTHRAALADGIRETVVTRAFTGRPARALRTTFIDRYDPVAPAGYPAVHHLTSPIRRAAALAGDTERLHLWAGAGYRQARAEPLAATFARLYQATGA